jgi:hypothetical protein
MANAWGASWGELSAWGDGWSATDPLAPGGVSIDDDTLRAVKALWLVEVVSVADAACIDDDTLRAVKALWGEEALLLPALFTEPIRAGRLKSTPDRLLDMPYAQASSELLNREKSGTSGHWHDHRKVTIRVWGLKDDVVEAIAILTGIFNVDTTLTYPSGARFIRWWPDGDAKFYQDETTRDGQDVWVGEIAGNVWSVRSQ